MDAAGEGNASCVLSPQNTSTVEIVPSGSEEAIVNVTGDPVVVVVVLSAVKLTWGGMSVTVSVLLAVETSCALSVASTSIDGVPTVV